MKSKRKGRRGEQEFASFLRDHGYQDAKRGQQYCGANGDADVIGLPGVHVEVKRTECLRLYDALAQAESDAKGIEFPVVFHRKNGKHWVAVLDAEDFLEIYANHRKVLEGV